jgi:hypothetical protein
VSTSEPKRYPYFGVPPARQPRPAAEEPALPGKRVVLSTPEGFVYDMRAASRIYTDGRGREVVDIVTEEAYFRWMFTKTAPQRVTYGVHLVWVE